MLKTLLAAVIALYMPAIANAQLEVLPQHELAVNYSAASRGYGHSTDNSCSNVSFQAGGGSYSMLGDRYNRYLHPSYSSPQNTTATVCFVAGVPTFLVGSFILMSADGSAGGRKTKILGGAMMGVGAALIGVGVVIKWRDHGDERFISWF